MTIDRCISDWIDQAKAGDETAVQLLWEQYFDRLIRLAKKKLEAKNYHFGIANEEDVALSAFKSLWKGLSRGRFPRLTDENDLWRLLVVITARKATDYVLHNNRQKRGGGRIVRNQSEVEKVRCLEPSPEFAAMFAEEYENLLLGLGDDSLRQVAAMKMEGYTNVEIAGKLEISPRTVARKMSLVRKLLDYKCGQERREADHHR